MISLYTRDLKKEKDFLIYELGKINIVFSTSENDRSFNRHKDFGVDNLNSIVKDFNLDNIQYLNQIHSDNVFVYNKINGDIRSKEGDALITKEENTAIGIFTADCVPIIIADGKEPLIL